MRITGGSLVAGALIAAFFVAAPTASSAATGDLRTVAISPPQDFTFPSDSAVSPDGDHVYLASGGIRVYRRAADGSLTLEQALKGGVDFEPTIAILQMALSPDGRFLYGVGAGAMTVFEIDAANGRLSVVQTVSSSDPDAAGSQYGLEGLQHVADVAISPDGANVYTLSENRVAWFDRNPQTGRVQNVATAPDGPPNSGSTTISDGLMVTADGLHVYAVDGLYGIIRFRRDPADGSLSEYHQDVSVPPVPGLNLSPSLYGPVAIAGSATGEHIYLTVAASFGTAYVAAFSRDPATGELTGINGHKTFPATGGPGGPSAQGTALTPDGEFLVVAGLSPDPEALRGDSTSVDLFARDPATGAISHADLQRDNFDGFGAIRSAGGVSIDPQSENAYIAGYQEHAISALAIDPVAEELAPVDTDPAFTLGRVEDLALAPDGGQLYAVSADDRSLSVLRHPGGSDELERVQLLGRGDAAGKPLDDPRAVEVTADGKFVFVAGAPAETSFAGPVESTIGTFERDQSDGTLEYRSSAQISVVPLFSDGLRLEASPDSSHLYATSTVANELVAYAIDPATGALTEIDRATDGLGGVDGLERVNSLAVAPDGATVYGGGEEGISVFSRAADGTIDFVERVALPHNFASGILATPELLVHLDGSGRLLTYGRDQADGSLTEADQVDLGDGSSVPDLAWRGAGDRIYAGLFRVTSVDLDPATGGVSVADQNPRGTLVLAVTPGGERIYGGANTINVYADSPDTDAPETELRLRPPDPTGPTPSFGFVSDELDAGFRCSIGPAIPVACSPGWEPSALTDGIHTFRVFAVDRAGNADPTPVEYTFGVDATAPATTITDGPATGSFTNDPTPRFEFEADDASANFRCTIDGGSGPCSGPGFHEPAEPLADGTHAFRVTAIDPVGNADPTPPQRLFEVDTDPPESRITSGPADDGATNDPTPRFEFSTDEGLVAYYCAFDAGAPGPCSGLPFHEPPPPGLVDGTHTFRVFAVDRAGNADPSPAQRTFRVDATPPGTAITSGPADGSVTGDATPRFEFESDDPSARFECALDGGFDSCSGTGFHEPSPGLGLGQHTFRVRAIDVLGNTDQTPATVTFQVVTAGLPSPAISSGPAQAATINDPRPRFTFTGPSGATFECAVDQVASFAPCSGPGPSHVTPALADGLHTFIVRAIQVDFLPSDPVTRTFVVDTTRPRLSLVDAPPAMVKTKRKRAILSFAFEIDEPTAVAYCAVDGADASTCRSPYEVKVKTRKSGRRTVRFGVIAVDRAGNLSDPVVREVIVKRRRSRA